MLDTLFDRPIVRVRDIQDVTGTTFPSANALVGRLVEIGILHPLTPHARNRRFRYASYIDLLSASGE